MKTPLRDAVRDYIKKDLSRFHMPGHKGRGGGFFAPMMMWDITEVNGTDSLYEASGAILALEEELATMYGAKRTLLSAGGATLCIQTMISLVCNTGAKIIMGRGAHRSAVNTAALLDLVPVWVYPRADAGDWFSGRYSSDDIEELLIQNPDAAAVYITSPDYFGVISDITAIAQICAKYQKPLLVDNAHGAHIPFLPAHYGIQTPLQCGASMCCDSLHKTMPAMTGGALLHIMDDRYINDAKRMMSIFASSSPSYPIMLSCESAGVYAAKHARAEFARAALACDHLRVVACKHGLAQPRGLCDPLKLSFAFGAVGWTAEQFGEYLRMYGMEPEYISQTACVLMASAMNSSLDFKRLERAIENFTPKKNVSADFRELPRPLAYVRIRSAMFSTSKHIAVENSYAQVVAGEVSACPPGIPIVIPGEIIDAETIEALLHFGVKYIDVIR